MINWILYGIRIIIIVILFGIYVYMVGLPLLILALLFWDTDYIKIGANLFDKLEKEFKFKRKE